MVPFCIVAITVGRLALATGSTTTVSTTQIENVNKAKAAWLAGCFPVVFGSIFTIAGLAVLAFAGIWPLLNWYQGLSWVDAPCTIDSASIRTNQDSDGDTYSPEVSYTYQWKGDNYQGTRFAWDSTSYGNRASIEKWMEPYPVGAKNVCYVDPANPKEAVLVRSFPKIVLFIIPFGLIFVAVGLAVAWGVPKLIRGQQSRMQSLALGQNRSSMRTLASSDNFTSTSPNSAPSNQGLPVSTSVPHETGEANEPLVIQPKMGRWASLVAILLICCFWNGIVSVFLFSMFGEKNGPPIFMMLFLTPFVLVGLGLMAAVVYTFLGLFNPKPVLVCSDRWLYAGSEFELSWMMKGNVSRIQKLTVFLEGTETVSYRQGTSTRTENNLFYSQPVAEVTDAAEIAQSYHVVKIPDDAMHTFNATSNKIYWQVRFAGEIPWWPDVADTFEITILPPLPFRKDA
jgi:hypothetical protein